MKQSGDGRYHGVVAGRLAPWVVVCVRACARVCLCVCWMGGGAKAGSVLCSSTLCLEFGGFGAEAPKPQAACSNSSFVKWCRVVLCLGGRRQRRRAFGITSSTPVFLNVLVSHGCGLRCFFNHPSPVAESRQERSFAMRLRFRRLSNARHSV